MSKLVDKVLGIMGLDDDDKEVEVYEENEDNQNKSNSGKKAGQVLSIHSQQQMRVVVMDPKSFEDSQAIADNLKNRRPVVVNLDHLDSEVARRVIDFCSGTTYALNGSLQKVGNGIYLFVPSNIDIAAEVKEEEKGNKSVFTWAKS